MAGSEHLVIAAQCIDHSAYLAGVPVDRFLKDARLFARTQLLVTEYYGFDVPSDMWDVYNIEAEALGQKIVFHPDQLPDVDRAHPLLPNLAALRSLRPPDPHRSGRMPWVHQVNREFIELTGKPAHVYFCAPFSLAANIRGYLGLIQDMWNDSAEVHRLFEFLCDDVLVPYIEAMRREIGNPSYFADGADAWASPPMITPDMMDEFVLPYAERLRGLVGGRLVTRGNWGDAKTPEPERFMAQKLKACPGSLGALDPDLFELGPHRFKAFAHSNNARVVAGIDAGLLWRGPIPAIVDRVKRYVDALGRDGRCALFLNHIPFDTPPAHVHAAVAACHQYGRLPIVDNLDDVRVEVPERESFREFLRRKGERLEG